MRNWWRPVRPPQRDDAKPTLASDKVLTASVTTRYRAAFVLLLTLVVCLAFAAMIRNFLLAVLMAAVFSALLHPLYHRMRRILHTGPAVTSGLVIFGVIIAVGIPLLAFAGLVAAEALQISEAVAPWLERRIDGGAQAIQLPPWLPFAAELEPYKTEILGKLGEVTGGVGRFLFESIREATQGTFDVLLNLFVFLYAMFFFLMRGAEFVDSVLRFLPLGDADRQRLIARGLAVTKATLKSILVVGVVQGTLVGAAFWLLGIGGAAFWGTVVLVLSAIPAVGSPLVWGPAVIYLFAVDRTGAAIGLAVWGGAVVSVVDNILRPRVVGNETQISDLLILLAILGGIGAFGIVGIIVGPILAAVFLTVLDIYRSAFADMLPEREPAPLPAEERQEVP